MGMYEQDGLGMFHGRLVLLGALGLLGFLALAGQQARLSLLQGPSLREEAEARLVQLAWEPTVRGRILDRQGRVLAQDRPTFDVRVDYAVLSGQWAEVWGVALAREAHAGVWRQLHPAQRDALARAHEPVFVEHVQRGLAELALVADVPLEDILASRDAVVARVENIHDRYVSRRFEALLERAGLGEEAPPDAELAERLRAQAARPVAEQRRPHTVIGQVPDAVGFAVLALRERTAVLETPVLDLDGRPTGVVARVRLPVLPGLEAGHARDRQYPFRSVTVGIDRSTLPGPMRGDGFQSVTVTGTLDAIVGTTRDRVFEEDPRRRRAWLEHQASEQERAMALTERGTDRGRYMEGDHVGHAGVEAQLEHGLRGLRGVRIRRLDTGSETVFERAPGRDVTLTIDALLQGRIAAAMSPEIGLAIAQHWHGDINARRDDGRFLAGAAVVIDIETGEVLAMVSTPTPDPQNPAASAPPPESAARDDWSDPRIHRAAQAVYPPGSIAKALTLVWAASRGEQRLGERIPCTGHFLPGRQDILRCWIWRPQYGMLTHSTQLGHDPDEAESLMVSCNIYFYELGRRLGPARMLEAYRAFGAGQPPIDAMGSAAGILGSWPVDPGGNPAAGLTAVDAALMGIGQGPVAWSPLHAADAYATLARGGRRLGPTLLRGDTPPPSEDIGLDQDAVERALQGLWLSTNDRRGTGYHANINGRFERYFNAQGVDIWGKTGTAQQRATLTKIVDGVPTPVTASYTHAWFVGLVGPKGQKPRYAISVMMEFAGSGGRVSAPIANQVVHALQAEGYLPGGQRPDWAGGL